MSAAVRSHSTNCSTERDYFAPALTELAAANVTTAKPICRDYACRHEGTTLDLTTLPPKMRTHTLRKETSLYPLRLAAAGIDLGRGAA